MTPQIPPHIQLEAARRELAAMKDQRQVAESAIEQLTDVMSVSADDMKAAMMDHKLNWTMRVVEALAEIRLLECQTAFQNLNKRCEELEGAIKLRKSGIVSPGGILRS